MTNTLEIPIAEFFILPDGEELYIEFSFNLEVVDPENYLALFRTVDSDPHKAGEKLQERFRIRLRSHVNKWLGRQQTTRDILAGSESLEQFVKDLDLSDLLERVVNAFVVDIHIVKPEGPEERTEA